jgi:fructose-1,6-bisphosphatase II
VIDLDRSPADNVRALAEAKGMYVEDLTVVVLDRPRHLRLIEQVRAAGARIKLISDGDVSAALATTKPETGIDLMMGIGRAPQGILAAAALKVPRRRDAGARQAAERDGGAAAPRGRRLRVRPKYVLDELVRGSVIVAATGVTPGDYLAGVRYVKGGAVTNSVVMRSATRTVRFMDAYHRLRPESPSTDRPDRAAPKPPGKRWPGGL